MGNEIDYIELGLKCAEVCEALDRGMSGKKPEDFSPSAREAIARLKTWVKPAMRSLDSSLTMPLIAEPSQRSRRRSSRRVGGNYSPDLPMLRVIRM